MHQDDSLGLTIGSLARGCGCSVQTIRHYERIGLLPTPARSAGGQRRYGSRHAERLAFLRHGRELGFSLDELRELLKLNERPDQACDAADRIARRHLQRVRSHAARLCALAAELERMVSECEGGRIGECRVIEVLADHSHGHCLSNDHAAELGFPALPT